MYSYMGNHHLWSDKGLCVLLEKTRKPDNGILLSSIRLQIVVCIEEEFIPSS